MRRRALRPSFVVTFALSATAIAGGCSSKDSGIGTGSIGDGSVGDAGCPAEQPTVGAPCDVPASVPCPSYTTTCQTWWCQQGVWVVIGCTQNPPPPVYEAGPDVDDAAPDVFDAGADVYEGGPDVHDGGSDGEGQDGGHD